MASVERPQRSWTATHGRTSATTTSDRYIRPQTRTCVTVRIVPPQTLRTAQPRTTTEPIQCVGILATGRLDSTDSNTSTKSMDSVNWHRYATELERLHRPMERQSARAIRISVSRSIPEVHAHTGAGHTADGISADHSFYSNSQKNLVKLFSGARQAVRKELRIDGPA
jgi:hypothetical protein